VSLPRAATANSNCLYLAWYQDIISSATLDNKSSIVWTRQSKVLFLSFQRSQHTRTTRESKYLWSCLGIRFLAPYHHSARVYVWAEGGTASQCILRKRLEQNLPWERADEQQVLDSFRCLVTQGTLILILQAMSFAPVRRPTSIMQYQPNKKLAFGRRSRLLKDFGPFNRMLSNVSVPQDWGTPSCCV